MLDENFPCYSFKPSSLGNSIISSLFFSENNSKPRLVYNLQKPDLSTSDLKGCYAIALYDPHNLGIVYADVQVKAEWTQPALSVADNRAQNTASTALIPMVPETFLIQLYNPDHQITVKMKTGTWNPMAYWKFEMPVESFRIPSSSLLDQTQNSNDPVLNEDTPKVTFKWKRDGKISKNLTCYMVGKNDDGKKRKEPDITVAFFKGGKGLTLYEPNLRRVEVEDKKGFELVLLLSAVVIKDIFFYPTKEMFNIFPSKDANSGSKSKLDIPEVSRMNNSTPNIMSNNTGSNTHLHSSKPVVVPCILNSSVSSVFQTSRSTKSNVDQETERLKRLVAAEEKSRKDAEKEEERRTREMLKAEDEERRRREAAVEKETEELRKLYGSEHIKNHNNSHASATTEPVPKIYKLGGKILSTPLRVSPAVTSWLDARRKLTKPDES
ncbi:hypothetical protein OnM2_088036 [Erysiphe neolycopersici]|uniref:Uncharacterized protein n=1 Tax=Erysiphe neolycopersici TaxID=212602 RepID=A0A420HDK8_9PEZI|nr:hypothetical protein OnM2_088036 [Erysiphe neolycopersici]